MNACNIFGPAQVGMFLTNTGETLTNSQIPGGHNDVILPILLAWEEGKGGGVGDGLGGARRSRPLPLTTAIILISADPLHLLLLKIVGTGGPCGAGTSTITTIVVNRPSFFLKVCNQLQQQNKTSTQHQQFCFKEIKHTLMLMTNWICIPLKTTD